MADTFTNIEDLEKHLKDKFRGMMKSREMVSAGKDASKAMGRYVLDELADGGASGYDYDQTGDLHKMLADEARAGNTHSTASTLSMGYGYLLELNEGFEALRDEQRQQHWIGSKSGGRYVTIRLKKEKEMPKWIIAEFGTGRQAVDKPKDKKFDIDYTYRPGKEFMYGPSRGRVSGGKKEGYFMVGRRGASNLLGNRAENRKNFTRHPGVKAGQIFSRGLAKSKVEVNDILRDGIKDYLNN
jgi:hypothetical protein